MIKNTVGKVFLVGAGPGDPELLTLKALKILQSADAVIYDRLISQAVLDLIPVGIPRFYAGKSCKEKAMTQEEINELLVTLAKKGQRVVRLKGGDPLFFGRGGEELLMLVKHHIPYEIIPGITSAQGCSAYAGIPLTHRGLATGVRFITGHRMDAPETETDLELDWKGLADPTSTLVIYMGLANLPIITAKLLEHGLAPSTPAVAIEQGTLPAQQIIRGTLVDIAEHTLEHELEPPTLVIIGQVAGLSTILDWVSTQDTENPMIPAKIFTQL